MNSDMLTVFTTECESALHLMQTAPNVSDISAALQDLSGAAKLCGLTEASALLDTFASSLTATEQTGDTLPDNDTSRLTQLLQQLASLTTEDIAQGNTEFWLKLATLAAIPEKPEPITEPQKQENKSKSSANLPASVAIDEGMLQMFLTEARERLHNLSDGILQLEQGTDPATTLEELMRAAHSLKGAAKIVNLQAASELAHALEDQFVTLQKDPAPIDSTQADCLLRAVDGLEKLCLHNASSAEEYLVTLNEFNSITSNAESSTDSIAPPASPDATATETKSTPAAPIETAPAIDHEDSMFLRLSAQSVSRIMALSGEGVVSARRLEPLSSNLRDLQIRQTRILEFYDYLYQQAMQGNVDGALFAEVRRQLEECQKIVREQSSTFDRISGDFNELSERLYREALSSRMRPFSEGVQGLQRMVRDLCRDLHKPVDFQIIGLQTRVDRDILSRLEAPLGHLVRNAIDHGLQTAEERKESDKSHKNKLTLQALHWAGFLNVVLTDDGKGINLEKVRQKIVEKNLHTKEEANQLTDEEVIEFLFLPGFSTSANVTEISGRGVGLDVVRSTLQEIGGAIKVENRPGEGVTFRMQLPVTRSVVRVLLIRLGQDIYAITLNRIERLLRVKPEEICSLEGQRYIICDGQNISINDASPMLGHSPSQPDRKGRIHIVVVSSGSQLYGLQVNQFIGEKELSQRPLDSRLGKVRCIEAVLPLEDGNLALSLDIDDLITMASRGGATQATQTDTAYTDTEAKPSGRILVVDDSPTVREMEKRMLQDAGYSVDTACDGIEGWLRARSGNYRLIVSDIDMPRMNGIQLLQALRNAERFADTPIMLVSYKDDPQTAQQAENSGVDYYINKGSFNTGEFIDVVQQLYTHGREHTIQRNKKKS